MGNMIPSQQPYEATIGRPIAGVFEFRQQTTGVIRAVYIWGGAVVGTWYWNLRLAGAPQWAGTNRLEYTSSAGSKTGLAIAATRGDTVRVDLELKGQGSLTGPVEMVMITEEPD